MNYTDLTLTAYPNKIDARADITSISDGTNTIYTSSSITNNTNLNLNDDNVDVVKANDVNILQDAVQAVERVLGVNPQGSALTVAARLTSLSSADTTLTNNYNAHSHTGNGSTSPGKIDLTAAVTGLLPRANIDLSYSNSSALVANDLYMNRGSNVTLAATINAKWSATAGSGSPITGDLWLQKNIYTRTHTEWDMSVLYGGNANLVSDNKAYTGQSYGMANGSTISSTYDNLRNGIYVMTVRVRRAGTIDGSFQIGYSDGSYVARSFTAADMPTIGTYYCLQLAFNHNPTYGSNTITWSVGNHGGNTIYVDSVTFEPLHIAVYDAATKTIVS